jgi:tetratricopeptide (TPR) repeat protein
VDIDALQQMLKEFKLTPEQEKSARAARLKDSEDRVQTIKNLEKEYWNQLSPIEREAENKLLQGFANVKIGAYTEAVVAFDRALALKPRAYVWQRGIALYRLGRYREAAEHLEKDAALFAERFEVDN